jgi:hypothetical protein
MPFAAAYLPITPCFLRAMPPCAATPLRCRLAADAAILREIFALLFADARCCHDDAITLPRRYRRRR